MKHVMIKISKGLDIPFNGSPKVNIEEKFTKNVAVVGADFKGLKPSMMIEEGDIVKQGQPLFKDKRFDQVNYCAPRAGKIIKIQRGAKRVLQNIVIESFSSGEDYIFESYKISILN